MNKKIKVKKTSWIERFGDKIPSTINIYIILFLVIALFSALGTSQGWVAEYTAKGKMVTKPVKSFFSHAGINWLFKNAVKNLMIFPPFGVVVVVTFGIGFLEETGFFTALIKKTSAKIKKHFLAPAIVFIGVMLSFIANAGFVLWPPLAAILYKNLGKHPAVGAILAFLAVSAGFTANLLVGILDVLLVGISKVSGATNVSVGQNYYFMALATFVLPLAMGWVANKYMDKAALRFPLENADSNIDTSALKLSDSEVKGLKSSLWGVLISILGIALLSSPISPLRTKPDGTVIALNQSPFILTIATTITFVTIVIGYAYGKGAGVVKSNSDVINLMKIAINKIGSFVVLSFFAAQFIYLLKWTGLDIFLSVRAANVLQKINLDGKSGGYVLLVVFFFMTAFLNLFIGSSSTKWTIMAPIFVPIFATLKIDSAMGLLVYRIADSVTNGISPASPYVTALLVPLVASKLKKGTKFEYGNLIPFFVPQVIMVAIVYLIMFTIFYWTGIPLGW